MAKTTKATVRVTTTPPHVGYDPLKTVWGEWVSTRTNWSPPDCRIIATQSAPKTPTGFEQQWHEMARLLVEQTSHRASILESLYVCQQRIDQLESRFEAIDKQLQEMSTTSAIATSLTCLGIDGFQVKKPIPVVIQPDGDEFVASFFEANISTGGQTPEEAVDNLQFLLADMFELHENETGTVGSAVAKQRRILTEYICLISPEVGLIRH